MNQASYKNFLATIAPPASAEVLGKWGITTAQLLTSKVEELILPIFNKMDPNEISIYAVGGFGRKELAPFSDADLLFLTTERIEISNTIAALWDLGIKPSILVRKGGELITSVKRDLKFATTLIDARHLYGFELPLLLGPKEWIEKARPWFHREQEYERRIRLLKALGAGCQEPNIRDGRGGLRDLQLKHWLLKISEKHEMKSDSESIENNNILLGARTAIHLAVKRREDRMLLSDRRQLISWLGWENEDSFFQSVMLAMKRNAYGKKKKSDNRKHLVEEFKSRLRDVPLRPISGFLRLLDETGELELLLPEWRRIEGLVRTDSAHKYTPDEHTLRVIENLEALFQTQNNEINLSYLQRHDLLILAALFHDIGKGTGKNHEEEGTKSAVEFTKKFGFTKTEIERVSFLVRNHLLLSYNAFRRDIDDPHLIHDLAKKIGDVENLIMLYLLTVADLKAVSYTLWNDWKARLLDTLVSRLMRQCSSYLPPELFAKEAIIRRKATVEDLLSNSKSAEYISAHFDSVDGRYALAHTPEQIARHIQLIPELKKNAVVVERNQHPVSNCIELVVITHSHQGLFAEIAGTLSALDFNILSADISTRSDGVAIDTFRVSDSNNIDSSRWNSFVEDLKEVISGADNVENLLNKIMPYKKKSVGIKTEVSVEIDNESSGDYTIVEVMLPDEIGLLYRIASVFRNCEMSIATAIINTESEHGVDVFYVTDNSGKKIVKKNLLKRLKEKMLEIA